MDIGHRTGKCKEPGCRRNRRMELIDGKGIDRLNGEFCSSKDIAPGNPSSLRETLASTVLSRVV